MTSYLTASVEIIYCNTAEKIRVADSHTSVAGNQTTILRNNKRESQLLL